MTDTATKPQLAVIRAGEIITVPDSMGRREKYMVMKNCGATPFPAYYDDSCDAKFANVGNLMIHLEDHGPGTHRVAVWCTRHRWFEQVEASQETGWRQAGFIAE